jgi:hypothetical protein
VTSQNFSPVIIIKEQVNMIANIRRKNIKNEITLEGASLFKMLQELNPLIEENFNIETKHKILEALNEVDLSSVRKLPEEYMDILHEKEKIEKAYKNRSINLEFMKTIIYNLLLNVGKKKQVNNKQEKLDRLVGIFKNYSIEKMVLLFKEYLANE